MAFNQQDRNSYYRARYKADPEVYKMRSRLYRLKNPNHAIDWAKRKPFRYWAIGVLKSHARVGYKVKISISDLESIAKKHKKCSFCGCKLKYGRGRHLPNSASIDRLNNEKTLAFANVSIICVRCNTSKGSRTFKQFLSYCKSISKRFLTSSSLPSLSKSFSSEESGL